MSVGEGIVIAGAVFTWGVCMAARIIANALESVRLEFSNNNHFPQAVAVTTISETAKEVPHAN